MGNATTLDARHDSSAAGDCEVKGRADALQDHRRLRLRGESQRRARRRGREHAGRGGDITVGITSVAAGAAGGTITSESGDVSVTMPAAGGYSVQAQANADGVVNEGTLPATCTVNAAATNSKTVSCGTGPNYTVKAGTTSLLAKNVTLGYQ